MSLMELFRFSINIAIIAIISEQFNINLDDKSLESNAIRIFESSTFSSTEFNVSMFHVLESKPKKKYDRP